MHRQDSDIGAKIKVLWDGEIALAVEKPANLPTQAAAGIESLESILVRQLATRTDYLALPHRLDRPVSGVILVALRKRAARLLSEQFASHKIVKEYRAIVKGRIGIKGEELWIDHIRKIPEQAKAEIVDKAEARTRIAETRVQLLNYDAETDRSTLQLFPRTGRMHQLRVQTANRGHPIVGDVLYGGSELNTHNSRPLIPPHQFKIPGKGKVPGVPLNSEMAGKGQRDPPQILLRAHEILFHDPRQGARVTVTASDKWDESV